MSKSRPMTPKQAKFAREYLVDLSATKAARRAGYSAKTARSKGPQLLHHNPAIAAAIAAGQAKAAEKTGITQERVLKELALLAFSDVRDFVVDDHGNVSVREGAPDEAWRAVSSVKHRITTSGAGENTRTTREVELKLWDKPGQVKLAGRHVGTPGFFDKVELTGQDGAPLAITLNLDTHDRDPAE